MFRVISALMSHDPQNYSRPSPLPVIEAAITDTTGRTILSHCSSTAAAQPLVPSPSNSQSCKSPLEKPKSRSTNRKSPSSNATVITTCSSRNFPLVKNLGADEAFDYKDPACCSKIRKYTADKLKHALDTISIDTSAKTCADALSTTGGVYRALEPIDSPRKDIDSHSTLAYSATGEALTDYGRSACKEDFEFGVMFWELAGNLLEQGKLKVHPLSVRSGGLKGVLEGLQEMREGILLETA